jgi:roadblock/LC7 domain-containing protein
MAITQPMIDALKAKMMSGILTVEYDGRRVTYASVSDMQKAIAAAEAELAGASNATTAPMQSFATFEKD